MESTYSVVITSDKRGNPTEGYILRSDDGGQYEWVSDCEFSPFDTWIDSLGWVRRSLSTDMDSRFS